MDRVRALLDGRMSFGEFMAWLGFMASGWLVLALAFGGRVG